MADRRARNILLGEMVIVAYIEPHPLLRCLRGLRRAVHSPGTGWPLLFSFPTYLPTTVTPPGSPSEPSPGPPTGVSLEVREGTERSEVTVHADSISEAVGATRQRFPGGEVRVEFPIDGDEFFGEDGTAGGSTGHGDPPVLLPERARS